MKTILFTLLFSVSSIVLSQQVNSVSGTVIDAQTKAPISFVNVGFTDKAIGTITNENGVFVLPYETRKIGAGDVLRISSIGYETVLFSKDELESLHSYKVIVSLKPQAYNLDEVIITSSAREKKILGNEDVTASNMGYWKNEKALGGEIASLISVRKKNTKLHDLKFKVIDNLSDSIRVRVNVYNYNRGIPGKNLLTQNIFHTISRKKGWETIALDSYNIYVDDDVVVSLELVEVYGEFIYFSIAASAYGGVSFTREISQDRWKVYKKAGIGFSLNSSFPAKGVETELEVRSKPDAITLLWDTSFNLRNRDIKEELKLLKKYLEEISHVEVRVTKFNYKIQGERTFSCTNGKCKDLFDYLEEGPYHGASNYTDIFNETVENNTVILAFTDGNSFFGSFDPQLSAPIFVVNTLPKAAHKELQASTVETNGVYLNLARMSPNKALEYLLYQLEDAAQYKDRDAPIDDYYYGVVFKSGDSLPIANAQISVKGTLRETVSKSNGSYKITTEPGEVLQVTALGMKPKEIELTATRKVHIELQPDLEFLDEVYLEKKIKEKPLVMTPFGKKNPDAVGFSMAKQIKGEDINPSFTELWQILNWGTGINAIKLDELGTVRYQFRKFEFASFNLTTYAAIVLDGIVYDQNIGGGEPPYVHPQRIEKITLLQSALSTLKYGQAAAYGAIVIETKGYVENYTEEKVPEDITIKGNDYTEEIPPLEQARPKLKNSKNLIELQSSVSFKNAKENYFDHLKDGDNLTIDYFISAANLFETWDSKFAQTVRSNILALAPENVKALKVLAYKLDAKASHEESLQIYERIVNLQPELAQSYRDLAQAYVKTGNYKEAASLYEQMLYNTIPNVDFVHLQDALLNEFQHLIKNHKSKIDYKSLPNELLSLEYKQDIRIVLEWNQPAPQFELQFVNPNNKYYNFSHTAFNNKPLLNREIKDGVFMKEFIIDNSDPGRWLINLEPVGAVPTDIPSVMKYTLYRNYGMPNEEMTVKFIPLNQIGEKVTLDRFINQSSKP
ncbi:MAG: carboxypeptidase-like regulatory domain-containing protein [Bacteroidota bacterium]